LLNVGRNVTFRCYEVRLFAPQAEASARRQFKSELISRTL
jgi:hypothetical protein